MSPGWLAPAAAALLLAARAQENQAPAIRLEPPACGSAARRLRMCAYVVDETGIAQVRLNFRAGGARAYHWTPMAFDGALYCAWLPAPLAKTRAVEYYVEAVDDQFEPSRTADETLAVRPDCPAPPPPDPAPPPAVVGTTVVRQAALPEGFDPATVKPK
jgi:hypothetical protein